MTTVMCHLAVFSGLFTSSLPGAVTGLLIFVLLGSLTETLMRHALMKAPSAITRVTVDEKSRWLVTQVDGHAYEVTLSLPVFVHPWLTVLNVSGGGRHRTIILTTDNCDPGQFRRLRARLRFIW